MGSTPKVVAKNDQQVSHYVNLFINRFVLSKNKYKYGYVYSHNRDGEHHMEQLLCSNT